MVVVNPVLNMYCELMRTKIHRLRMLCENTWVHLSYASVLKLDTCVISDKLKKNIGGPQTGQLLSIL